MTSRAPVGLDHVVIHVADWQRSNDFYSRVLGAELIENPEGAGNPLGAWAYRFGSQQLNVHGPWPGRTSVCCVPPLNEPGRADLCFRWPGSIESALEHLTACGVELEEGPLRMFGARGWGRSVYVSDPDGASVELIAYEDDA